MEYLPHISRRSLLDRRRRTMMRQSMQLLSTPVPSLSSNPIQRFTLSVPTVRYLPQALVSSIRPSRGASVRLLSRCCSRSVWRSGSRSERCKFQVFISCHQRSVCSQHCSSWPCNWFDRLLRGTACQMHSLYFIVSSLRCTYVSTAYRKMT